MAFTTTILFGQQEPSEYHFSYKTAEELQAFLDGIYEGCGWMEYKIIQCDLDDPDMDM
jgi:hypothetical protein